MNNADLKLRIEKQENTFVRCMAMLELEIKQLKERIEKLEEGR